MCEKVFDAVLCRPKAVDDTVIFTERGETIDLALNDVTFGHSEDFVWVGSGHARMGLRLTSRGVLSDKHEGASGQATRSFQYQLCLKSGAGCWGPAHVTVHSTVARSTPFEEHGSEEPARQSGGLMQRSERLFYDRETMMGPVTSALECNATNRNQIGNLICPADFAPGCPYGYDGDYNCLPALPPPGCIDAAWKAKLAELWTDYFGDSTQVNFLFDGMLRQGECDNCERVS